MAAGQARSARGHASALRNITGEDSSDSAEDGCLDNAKGTRSGGGAPSHSRITDAEFLRATKRVLRN